MAELKNTNVVSSIGARALIAIKSALALWLTALAASSSALAQDSASSAPLWVDLRDIVEHADRNLPELSDVRAIIGNMQLQPMRYFPRGVRFNYQGATYARDTEQTRQSHRNQVFGVELYEPPVALTGSLREYHVIAMVHSSLRGTNQQYFFRKLRMQVDGEARDVRRVEIIEDIPLIRTKFTITVGLIDRMAVLVDVEHGITKIYPLGVGGFDEGVTTESRGRAQLLTPLFQSAKLERKWARFGRNDPWYFKDKPFIRITRRDGNWTSVAFHTKQNAKFVRGFESHGCMRLRDKDLYELYYIVQWQNGRSRGNRAPVIVDIANRIDFEGEHPYPRSDRRYKRVQNFGTASAPRERRECERLEDGTVPDNCRYPLTVMEAVYSRVPVERLEGADGDAMPVPMLMGLDAEILGSRN